MGRMIAYDKDKMRISPLRIDRNGKSKKTTKSFKDRKPNNLKNEPFKTFALDTVQIINEDIRRYILTMIDIDTRVAYAVAIPSKLTKYTALGLKALIKGMRLDDNHKISLLTDNGSEFALHFKMLLRDII